MKRSLARAMEQAWFDSLQAGVPARLDWKDKTWLEQKLAKYPDIIRYFSGAADEVLRLLAEIAREDALPDDATALAERFGGAVRRLNEVDPYYQFAYSVTGDTTTLTAHPKYPDAPADRPLQVTATLRFDHSPASQEIQSALRFCAALAGGEQMAITDPGGTVFGTASGSFDPADWPQAYIECAEKLARVQELAGASFPLPLEFLTPPATCCARSTRRGNCSLS